MPGSAFPKAEVAAWRYGGSYLSCSFQCHDPAGTVITAVPDPTDEIDNLGVGVTWSVVSTGGLVHFDFICYTNGHWTSRRASDDTSQ